jgi:hypothetical protein
VTAPLDPAAALSDGMNLTAEEARCVAARLVARWLAAAEWEWEDLPLLGEFAWDRLLDALESFKAEAWRTSEISDRHYNIDSVDLIDRAEA